MNFTPTSQQDTWIKIYAVKVKSLECCEAIKTLLVNYKNSLNNLNTDLTDDIKDVSGTKLVLNNMVDALFNDLKYQFTVQGPNKYALGSTLLGMPENPNYCNNLIGDNMCVVYDNYSEPLIKAEFVFDYEDKIYGYANVQHTFVAGSDISSDDKNDVLDILSIETKNLDMVIGATNVVINRYKQSIINIKLWTNNILKFSVV